MDSISKEKYMEENNIKDDLIAKMTFQLGLLHAQTLELEIMVENLREENKSLKLQNNINNHIESMTQGEITNE